MEALKVFWLQHRYLLDLRRLNIYVIGYPFVVETLHQGYRVNLNLRSGYYHADMWTQNPPPIVAVLDDRPHLDTKYSVLGVSLFWLCNINDPQCVGL